MADEVVKVFCQKCGSDMRNHVVLKSHVNNWSTREDDYDVSGSETYQICRCQGCDSVRFREILWFSEDTDPWDENGGATINVYPEFSKDGRRGISTDHFPARIKQIYSETIAAMNAGARILAGGGLRAIVEAICQDKGVTGRNLEDKIDKLKEMSFLTQSQSELLHEERYIGNKALHEIEAPRVTDLMDGLDIIEGMLNTIYVLPEKAKRLRHSRETHSDTKETEE